MRTNFVLLIVLGVALAPTSILSATPYTQEYDVDRAFLFPAAPTESTCPAPGVKTDITPAYPTTSTTYTSTTACLQSYETICRAPSGAVRCNKYDAVVKVTDRSSTTLYPALQTKGTGNVEQCISEGAYQHPEANAMLIAQCVVSFLVIIICTVLLLIRTWQHLSPCVRGWFIFTMLICILLLPSFYYLNGLIGAGAALLAVAMYSTRDSNAVAIGMTACISAVMWFTFESGLGSLTHSIRLVNANAMNPKSSLYENLCNQYYRFSYQVPLAALKDATNPLEITNGVCLRGWLATELFFSVFLIISLVVLAVGGAHALKRSDVVINPISDESAKPSSA